MKKKEYILLGVYILVLVLLVLNTIGRNLEIVRLNKEFNEMVKDEEIIEFYNLGRQDGAELEIK